MLYGDSETACLMASKQFCFSNLCEGTNSTHGHTISCMKGISQQWPSWVGIIKQVNIVPQRTVTTMTKTSTIVSEPDPQQYQKERLGERLGWKFTKCNVWNL